MASTLKFSLLLGGFASLLTFLAAWTANLWFVSLERAFYAFILFFVLGFPVHWACRLLLGQADAEGQKETAGQHVDLVAADDDGRAQPAKEPADPADGFKPLSVPRLEVHKKETVEPAEIANIVRRLADE
ncbi:hypothetical protein [Brevibacillus marinus]|jgi:hypothetical protein|uniref:hypothetical protein n=1 Tax=Brevibacillus marinus TaxID=2496837 RepID=UPI000F817A07|nr:hypothetical protein [Brevibacillus marinus]